MPVVKCAHCGTENPAVMRFCGECAAPLGPAEAGPTARPGGVSAASEPDGLAAGELRLVTVVFADFSGFTTLSEELDPEALRELMTRCFDRLVPVIERFGGTVHQFVGDEVMAVFGVPIAHEDDPERAVRCALCLHEALSAGGAALAPLRLHVGVASGRVFAGVVAVSGRHEYSIMGDAVNLAARLCQQASAAETLVGPEIERRASHMAHFASTGPVKLKGKRASVTPFRLLALKETAPGVDASGVALTFAARGISSPLVGREDELKKLADALEDAGDSRGSIVLVSGEAGIGKSRLMAELRRTPQGRRLLWREGRAVSHGESLSYQPFLEILEQDMGYEPADDEDRRGEKLVGRAKELFREQADEFVPYLATLLNVGLRDDLDLHLGALDSASMGHQVFRAVFRYIATVARRRPLAVVFEDVHWMDQSSVAMVEHILPLVLEVPLVVCVCGRPDPGSPTTRLTETARENFAGRLTEIDLSPLTRAESGSLLNNLVGAQALLPGLARSVLEKAEGNPFFLEEQLRALIDLGWLVPQDGAWRLTQGADELAIPDKLQDVITARIDLLDAATRRVLRLASVIGRSFTFSLLETADEERVDLDLSLMRLQESQLIQAKRGAGDVEYAFKHALVQEAAYESILHPRRRELHARVARGLEALFADHLPDVYSLLAFHYSRAEEWEKAQTYLFRAGNQASRIAADAEALEHYRRALAAYGQVFGDRWDPVDRAAVERRMGEALFHLGKHEEARRHLDQALSVLGHPLPTSPRALRRAVLREVLVQVSHRLLPAWLWRHGRRPRERAITEHCDVLCTIAWIETLGSSRPPDPGEPAPAQRGRDRSTCRSADAWAPVRQHRLSDPTFPVACAALPGTRSAPCAEHGAPAPHRRGLPGARLLPLRDRAGGLGAGGVRRSQRGVRSGWTSPRLAVGNG